MSAYNRGVVYQGAGKVEVQNIDYPKTVVAVPARKCTPVCA
ncbi:hypothetical protein [Pseudomonas plecoglossicida]